MDLSVNKSEAFLLTNEENYAEFDVVSDEMYYFSKELELLIYLRRRERSTTVEWFKYNRKFIIILDGRLISR